MEAFFQWIGQFRKWYGSFSKSQAQPVGKKLLTLREAAEVLCLSARTINRAPAADRERSP